MLSFLTRHSMKIHQRRRCGPKQEAGQLFVYTLLIRCGVYTQHTPGPSLLQREAIFSPLRPNINTYVYYTPCIVFIQTTRGQ